MKKRIILARLIVDSDERPVNAESVVAIIIVIKHRPIHEEWAVRYLRLSISSFRSIKLLTY